MPPTDAKNQILKIGKYSNMSMEFTILRILRVRRSISSCSLTCADADDLGACHSDNAELYVVGKKVNLARAEGKNNES